MTNENEDYSIDIAPSDYEDERAIENLVNIFDSFNSSSREVDSTEERELEQQSEELNGETVVSVEDEEEDAAVKNLISIFGSDDTDELSDEPPEEERGVFGAVDVDEEELNSSVVERPLPPTVDEEVEPTKEELMDVALRDPDSYVAYVDSRLSKGIPVEESYARREPRAEQDEHLKPTPGLITPKQRWNGNDAAQYKDESQRYYRDNKKMLSSEEQFFVNAETTIFAARNLRGSLDNLRAPVGEVEKERSRAIRMGNIARVISGEAGYKKKALPKNPMSYNKKDEEVLQFIAMFKFAKASNVANMFSVSNDSARQRLNKLKKQGLVESRQIVGTEPIWGLTRAGALLSGYDVPSGIANISMPNLTHYFGINYIASNIWGANINVLNEKDFPPMNRMDSVGHPVPGDEVVSEYMIQSSFGKMRSQQTADVYRRYIMERSDAMFEKWENKGGVEFGPSPEMVQGQEFLWVLFPPRSVKHNYHVPDLVVPRQRNEDGSPNSIAVEIELSQKSEESYRKALQAFYHDRRMFKEVVWVCSRPGTARRLLKVGREIGLVQEKRLRIAPFLNEDGTVKHKEMWGI